MTDFAKELNNKAELRSLNLKAEGIGIPGIYLVIPIEALQLPFTIHEEIKERKAKDSAPITQ